MFLVFGLIFKFFFFFICTFIVKKSSVRTTLLLPPPRANPAKSQSHLSVELVFHLINYNCLSSEGIKKQGPIPGSGRDTKRSAVCRSRLPFPSRPRRLKECGTGRAVTIWSPERETEALVSVQRESPHHTTPCVLGHVLSPQPIPSCAEGPSPEVCRTPWPAPRERPPPRAAAGRAPKRAPGPAFPF